MSQESESGHCISGEQMNNDYRCNSVLAEQRRLRGWSQRDLVREVCRLCYADGEFPGLDVKSVGRWERGEAMPSPFYLKRLCQIFHMNARELGFM
jgi:transcriptional regulator with XRE-family HTH domain